MATNIARSGDGTRPTTDGGIDNIGGGEKFTTRRTAAGGEVSAPGPAERAAAKRMNAENSRRDDSAPFGLHEDLTPDSNMEPLSEPPPDRDR